MIFNTLFNNIYVINLESCPDRKEHIINEFNRVGIEKYEFFTAFTGMKNKSVIQPATRTRLFLDSVLGPYVSTYAVANPTRP
jgi:hypothetical protein